MKRISLFLCLITLCLISQTSCLDGSNEISGYALGVFRLYGSNTSNPLSPVFKSTVGDIYSSNMNSIMNDGKCYYIYYTFSSDDPENTSAMIALNGYSTITLRQYEDVDSYSAYSVVTDISQALPDEVPLTSGYNKNNAAYVDGYLFMTHTTVLPEDVKLDWNLSYEYASMPTVDDYNDRYYDLYLRATKLNNSDKTVQQVSFMNAYNLKTFLTEAAGREQGTGATSFKIRINYVSAISELGILTWSNVVEELPTNMFN